MEASACVKAWKSFPICSRVIPIPVSCTRNVSQSRPSSAAARVTSSRISPSRVTCRRCSPRGLRRQEAVVDPPMSPGGGHQAREPFEPLQRREPQGGRAVGPRAPDLGEEPAPRGLRPPVQGRGGRRRERQRCSRRSRRGAGTATATWRRKPSSRAPRGGAAAAAAADRSRRTGWPARGPRVTRPGRDAATAWATRGACAANGSVPPSSSGRRPRRMSRRRTRRSSGTRRSVMAWSVGGGVRWKMGTVDGGGRV